MDLPKKLQIRSGTRIKMVAVPNDVLETLRPFPEGARLMKSGKLPFDGALVFCRNRKDVEEKALKAAKEISKDGLLWLCYPKQSSGLATDISRDKGWEKVQSQGLRPVRAVSINDTWSALRWRPTELVSKVIGEGQ